MKLTKDQFITYVNKFKEMSETEDVLANMLGVVEWKPMEWINEFYALLSEMCELPEDKVYGTDLDWFCYDADFGRNSALNRIDIKNEDGIYEEKYVIKSAEDLWDYWAVETNYLK